jgi:hypothetical protein
MTFFLKKKTYCQCSKNTHNVKYVKFEIFRNSKYISKFQKSFTTCKWGVMYMTYETKFVVYNIRK